MTDQVARTLLQERIMTTLAALTFLGLVLVGIDVYGVVAFRTSRRTKEMGIRLALAAGPNQVILLMLLEMPVPVGLGVALGVMASIEITALAQKVFFAVSPTDLATFGGSCATLVLLAPLASWLPGRRASRLSPATTMRSE